jgi:hypothetical protein
MLAEKAQDVLKKSYMFAEDGSRQESGLVRHRAKLSIVQESWKLCLSLSRKALPAGPSFAQARYHLPVLYQHQL